MKFASGNGVLVLLSCLVVSAQENIVTPKADQRSSIRYIAQNDSSRRADSVPVPSKNPKSLGVGKLLVASRDLGDPNFAETVVLLVHYDAQGVVGLVLNRRTDFPLSRLLQALQAAKDRSDSVYLGGPLETPAVIALFQSPTKIEGAEQIFGPVYLISAKAVLEKTISARPDPGVFHVYMGYAGWTQDQLRKEVELGAWFIFPGDTKTVFSPDPESLWQQLIRETELKLARGADIRTKQPCCVISLQSPGRGALTQTLTLQRPADCEGH